MLAIDHLILVVDSMATVSRQFSDAGFKVVERADKGTRTTGQKFVSFADGSYIEILAFGEGRTGNEGNRLHPLFVEGGGWADFAVLTDDLDAMASRAEAIGKGVRPRRELSKSLQDGREWRLATVTFGQDLDAPYLPFAIEELGDRAARVPAGDAVRHDCGATGIASITIDVADLDRAAGHLSQLLGREAQSSTDGQGRRIAIIRLDMQAIVLRQSASTSGIAHVALAGPASADPVDIPHARVQMGWASGSGTAI